MCIFMYVGMAIDASLFISNFKSCRKHVENKFVHSCNINANMLRVT